MRPSGLSCRVVLSVSVAGTSVLAAAGPAAAGPLLVEPVLVDVGTSAARSVAVGDIDGDGIVDLVTPTRLGGVTAVLGQGDGTFGPAYLAGRTGRFNVVELGDSVLADFDGDGRLDLAVGAATGLQVLRNVGAGQFGRPTAYQPGSSYGRLVVAELNGDGDPDLLLALAGEDAVGVYLGGPGMTFEDVEVAVGDVPRGLDVADLDQDGDLDFAVANVDSDTVSLRFNDGTGTFDDGAEVAVRPAPQDVVLRDVEGDGLIDLVVGSNGDPLAEVATLAVLRGSGPAEFTEIRTYETLRYINDVQAADLNADGYLDFAVGTGNNGAFGFGPQVAGYLSVLDGRPGAAPQGVLSQAGTAALDVAIADLDGDGALDVVSTKGLFSVAVLFNPLA